MTARVLGETIVGVFLTAVLAVLGGALAQSDAVDTVTEAIFDQGPRLIFTGFAFGGVLWIVLVIVGNIVNRRRASGWAFMTNLVSMLAAGIVNVVVWTVVGFTAGGWAMLMVAIAIMAGLITLIAAVVALALTHFVFFRHARAAAS